MAKTTVKKVVAIIMGSQSDFPVMENALAVLESLKIKYEALVVSAHRTPEWMFEFAKTSEEKYSVIIAAAGGAAHLPGMVASLTSLPVIGVPIKTKSLDGLDSLFSIVQMPKGVPVMTMAINGAENAALSAARILSLQDEKLKTSLKKKVEKTKKEVLKTKKLKKS